MPDGYSVFGERQLSVVLLVLERGRKDGEIRPDIGARSPVRLCRMGDFDASPYPVLQYFGSRVS